MLSRRVDDVASDWVGTGSFHLTGLSDHDPQLPVVEHLEAALYTDALVTLAATPIFPVK
ncbi:hypothetical protein [Streptomyces sp. HD]|uniref:hypothetical protein n=1 Tax=Streptomyces sp. HD TaxID=3020892 RepID=UPI00232BFFB8|nr:hypothetical protein [Streptomyces sp. HD]MDC0766466.1 hypothetical protein [Streptomyces sp. HD]